MAYYRVPPAFQHIPVGPLGTVPQFNRGFLMTRVQGAGVLGETHYHANPQVLWSTLFGLPNYELEEFLEEAKTSREYAITPLGARAQQNEQLGFAMTGNSKNWREVPPQRVTAHSKAINYNMPQFMALGQGFNSWQYAHDIAAEILQLIPNDVTALMVSWLFSDQYGLTRRTTDLFSLDVIVIVLKDFLDIMLAHYAHDLGQEGFHGVTGIVLQAVRIYYVYSPIAGAPLLNRPVFGNDGVTVEKYMDHLSLEHSQTSKVLFQGLRNFLKRKDFGLYIPRSRKNCILECLIVNKNYGKYKEQGFPAKTISKTVETMRTKLNHIKGRDPEETMTFGDTISAYKQWIAADKRIKNNERKQFEIWAYDFHMSDIVSDFELDYVPVRQLSVTRAFFIIILNHCCLLVPNEFKGWDDSMKIKNEEITELIKVPIRNNYANRVPLQVGTFDIETYVHDFEQVPFMCGMFLFNQYQVFKGPACCQEFATILKRVAYANRQNILLFAHNGGKFDFYLVLKTLLQARFQYVESIIKGNRIYRMKFFLHYGESTDRNQGIYIILQDMYTLVPMSLKSATEAFQTAVKKKELDQKVFNWKMIDSTNYAQFYDVLAEYLENDCVSLYHLFVIYSGWIRVNLDIDIKFSCSLSSISKEYFLSKYYNEGSTPIYILNEYYYKKIKKAYMGGRCDCFCEGKVKNLYYYDFNSLYPYAMLNPMPVGQPAIFRDFRNFNLSSFFGFIKVQITGMKMGHKFGVFPIRGKTGLFFPIIDCGTSTWIFSEELKSFEYLYTWKPIKAIRFDKADLFSNFVETLYKLKAEATRNKDPVKRLIAKLLLNSAYGFWGLKRDLRTKIFHDRKNNTQNVEDFRQKLMLANWYLDEVVLDHDNYWLCKEYCPSKSSNVAIAAAVTAYARITLNTLILEIQKEGGTVAYCDTDSVFTTLCLEQHPAFAKYFDVQQPEKLGLLKNELGPNKKITEAVFLGPKFYAYLFDNVQAIKMRGFPQKKYLKKSIDGNLKEIVFEDPDQGGTEHLKYSDLVLVLENGYKVVEKRDEMKVSLKCWFSDFSAVEVRKKEINYEAKNKKMEKIDGNELVAVTTSTLISRKDLKRKKD